MLVVWRFYDGKPGHDRQSLGLVQALADATAVETFEFDVHEQRNSFVQFLTGRLRFGEQAPAPHLILGAGRRCQWPMLASKRVRGGATVYLMKPQLPTSCFDVCVIPRHDRPNPSPQIIVTDGVLNNISVSPTQSNEGLLLIGGPSNHYGWDVDLLLRQIETVLEADPEKKWVIADSRRTPLGSSAAIQCFARENVEVITYQTSTPDTLTRQLARADTVWVSSDSVSMIYEALTSGAAVGVFDVPAKRTDRITTIVHDLAARNMVTTHADWEAGAKLSAREGLGEAARCAQIILSRWDPTSLCLRADSTE